MADKKSGIVNPESPRTLTDEQIVTERKLPRRSFLTTTGALLVAGAAVLVSGVGAAAQDTKPAETPKKEKEADPDAKKKETGTKSGKKGKKAKAKAEGAAKEADPDKPKPKPPQR